MKNKLRLEFEKLKSINSIADLHLAFFRMVQVISIFSIVYSLGIVFIFAEILRYQEGTGAAIGLVWLLVSIALSGAQFLLAEFALQAIARKQFWGTAIGLVISALMLPSWLFAFAGFGFYCFLNADYQLRYLENSPKLFRDILSALKINRIDVVSAK